MVILHADLFICLTLCNNIHSTICRESNTYS
nr:MAG TPA: hypothetical protein [Bacteriophage sp.]